MRWLEDGLEIVGATTIESGGEATKVNRGVSKSGALTVEAWVTPANAEQKGPARMVTVSQNSSARNVKLGASCMARVEAEARHTIGIGSLMWGTDYPHPEGSWPDTKGISRLGRTCFALLFLKRATIPLLPLPPKRVMTGQG